MEKCGIWVHQLDILKYDISNPINQQCSNLIQTTIVRSTNHQNKQKVNNFPTKLKDNHLSTDSYDFFNRVSEDILLGQFIEQMLSKLIRFLNPKREENPRGEFSINTIHTKITEP